MPVGTELIAPAFVMGLAGNLHCVGMCGPLALSLPVSHENAVKRISGGLIYNAGRIVSYAALGLVFGSLGNVIISTGWQSGLSVVLGLLILLYLFVPKRYFHFSSNSIAAKPFMYLRQRLGNLFQSKYPGSSFFIGVLNGFLPCGLVYLALTSSVISANSINGAMFMLFFGLGTFPMMFAATLMGNYLNQSLRRKIQRVVPVMLFFMAVLLILRGMNLGIPFISPGFNAHPGLIECH